jgi:amidase
MPNETYDRREFLGAAAAGAAVAAGSTAFTVAAATADELCFSSAVELARLIQTRQVSAREVMAAHLTRIERFNPRLNAIVAKLDDDECLALANAADRRAAGGERLPPLHGLPMAFKDL